MITTPEGKIARRIVEVDYDELLAVQAAMNQGLYQLLNQKPELSQQVFLQMIPALVGFSNLASSLIGKGKWVVEESK